MLCGKFGVLLCDFVFSLFWFLGVVIWAFLNYELPWIVLACYCSHCIIEIVSVCFISQLVGFVVVNSSVCLGFFLLWRFFGFDFCLCLWWALYCVFVFKLKGFFLLVGWAVVLFLRFEGLLISCLLVAPSIFGTVSSVSL